MRSQVTRILRKSQNLTSKNVITARYLTTTSDPKKSIGLAVRTNDDSMQTYIQESTAPSLILPNADVFSYTLQNISKYMKLTAVECGISGRSYNFAQMLDGALRFATVIQKLIPGVKNPTVAFLSPNSPEYLSMFLGCMAMGATVSPINPLYTPGEIANHINDCNASLLVVDAMVETFGDAALKLLGKNIPIIVNGQSSHNRPNVQDILVDPSIPVYEPKDIDPSTIAFLPYSSGTTGKPKGVKLSHAAITNNLAMNFCEHINLSVEGTESYQESFLGILPFFHIYGVLASLLSTPYYGGKLITMPMFEPSLFVSAVKKHNLSVFLVVPPLLNFIAMNPAITKEDMTNCHTFIVGGAPVQLATTKLLQEKTVNATFQEGYGLTEALLTHVTPVKEQKLGYCGRLLSNCQARIIDLETGEDLPADTKGELCIKSPSIMSGYHNNDEATKEAIDEEGWLHTGDVAIYTEDGYYSIVDRIKELVKVNGFQVSPSEVEEVLVSHPSIAEAGVVAVQHPRFGEAPLAFIVRSDPSLTESEVHKHMEQNMAKHKQLAGGIQFVDELPKSQTGKLLRRVLKGLIESNNQ